ncbi:DUF6320 domain-containing protein [Christensenella intestinihominis]|uniref:DUF6320 domain-containing protein n=1 Tax=Christensenella intestinihominis TaxID=1851429 RepID=UPI000834D421|nr:DUF6320 domain-containing protein [Christensenella intestinihominis]
MGKCEYCGVTVKGSESCPLCGRPVQGKTEKMYPACPADQNEIPEKRTPYWPAVVTAGVVGICALVNLVTRGSSGGYWCLDIAVIFAYLWVLVLHTVKSKTRGSFKLMLQACLIVAMLCVFDWNAGRGLWSVNFAIPFACIGMIFLATYIVMTRKINWSGYIGYMVAVALFGQIPIMGILLGLTHFVWPSFAAAGYAVFTFLMMLMFANGRYKDAQTRRFRF